MLYKQKKDMGYTIVEFVMIAMIFGTIFLLILPTSDKIINRFKQKEATGIINSLIKAAQSSYALFGHLPADMGGVSKFVKFDKCTANNVKAEGAAVCKGLEPVAVENKDISFYSPSGNYKVEMRRAYTLDGQQIYQVKANPNGGKYLNEGSAVVGCFNPSNGMTQVKEYASKSSDRGIKSFIKCSTNLVLLTEEEKSKLERQRLEQERLEEERIEAERQRLEQERLEEERIEAERLRRESERRFRDLRRRRRR